MPRRPPEPPIYTFRVRILSGAYAPPDAHAIWREIEVAASQTLLSLGNAIPRAFDFEDMHLWSFFLSGRAWDHATEYTLYYEPDLPTEPPPRTASRTRVRDVSFPNREFLYVFDYGDNWHFGVTLVRTSDTVEPRTRYPRVVAGSGIAPPQYPDLPDDEEADDETPVRH